MSEKVLWAAVVDPERPNHRDLWPFNQLHSRGIVATGERAEPARIQAGMYVIDLGCGLGGSSRYLAAECSCRVSTFDHVGSYAVTMNIADKERLGREVARVLKTGGYFSCNEIAQGTGGAPVFPLPWTTNEASSFLATPAVMRAAPEAISLILSR